MKKGLQVRKLFGSASLLILTVILSVSCDFDQKFLKPYKIPAGKETLTIRTSVDTTVVLISNDNHQPVFTSNGKDTLDLGYTIESVVFESSSHNRLNGWLLKPLDMRPDITLVHFHGNGGCLYTQYRFIAPIVEDGFQVFMFDYSGYGFSEGKATLENIFKDANSALDYVLTRPDFKDTKLVIYGQSLGGHLAAMVGPDRQGDIDGLVIEAAFSSYEDIAANSAGEWVRPLISDKYRGYESIRGYEKPLLIIHSKDDADVPVEMGKKLFENANEPKEFYEIGQDHIRGVMYYADEISERIRAMLETE